MKKIAYLFTILNFCAVSFVACDDGDDRNKDVEKLENGATCNVSGDCKSDYCNGNNKCANKPILKENGETCAMSAECKSEYCDSDKKCANKLAEGAICQSDDDCASNLCDLNLAISDSVKCIPADSKATLGKDCRHVDCGAKLDCDNLSHTCKIVKNEACESHSDCITSYCSKTKVCEKMPTKFCNSENYTIMCDSSDPENVKAWSCVEDTLTETACSADQKCVDGKGCIAGDILDKECIEDSDCAKLNSGKPYCNKEENVCVESKQDPKPLCGNGCTEGECIQGICVTDAMKAVEANSTWVAGNNISSYCVDDLFYYQTNGKTHIYDCSTNGYSGCIVFEESTSEGQLSADCNSTEAIVNACKELGLGDFFSRRLSESAKCISDSDLAYVICQKDTRGNMIAIPDYNHDVVFCDEMGCDPETNNCIQSEY